jgi:hypothetical protein
MGRQHDVTWKTGAVKLHRRLRRRYVLMRILTHGVYGRRRPHDDG